MTDPAQPSGWGTEVPAREPEVRPWAEGASVIPRGLQEHHESWTLGQPLPAEPALMADGLGGTGTAADPGHAADPAVAVKSAPADAAPGAADLTGATQAGIAHPAGTGGQVVPDRDDRWAMASYLGAIFFWLLAPLVIYLIKRNRSLFVRTHAAQAFNLTLTATLFAISGGIVAGVLALDSPRVALFVMGPVLLAFWIVVLVYVIRAASSASRDEFYEIPGWICVPTLH